MEVRQPQVRIRPNAAVARIGSIRGLRQTLLAGFFVLVSAWPVVAMGADEDLPGASRVCPNRTAKSCWQRPTSRRNGRPVGLNYPITSGDNLWVGNDGRAEVDFGGGQFRVAGGTNLQLSRLDDANVSIFVAQGRMILRIRVLEPGDMAVVDTPNAQIALTRVGLYRFEVSGDREHTQVSVREGEANVYAGNAIQQVLPGQTAAVDGFEPKYAAVTRSYGPDGFDTWSANRDRKYDRRGSTNYVSRQMVGYADLDEYGTWESAPEYGPVWYPNSVATGWAPYRDGYWANVGAFGWTWVDVAPWGYAPFHYGRWAFVRGRWGWAPGTYVARPTWAPALVGWVGGPGWSVSASHGAPVYGWVPLGWAEPYRPGWRNCSNRCWERYNRPYAVNVAERPSGPPARFANGNVPGAVTAVPDAAFTSRRSMNANLVAVTAPIAAGAPVLSGAPMVRPSPNLAPGPRVGEGAPAPASTLYPTARPGVPYRGIAPSANIAPTPQLDRAAPAPGNSPTTLPNRPGNAPMARQSPNSAPVPQTNGSPPNNAVNTFGPRGAPPGTPPTTTIGNNNANPPPGYKSDAITAPATPPAPRQNGRTSPVPSEVVPGQTRNGGRTTPRPGGGRPGQSRGNPPSNANTVPPPPTRQSRQVPPAAQPTPAVPAQPAQQLTRPSPTTAPSAAAPMRAPPAPAAPVNRPPPAPSNANEGSAPQEPKPQRLIRTPPPGPEGNQPAK